MDMPRYDLTIAIFDTIRYIVPSLLRSVFCVDWKSESLVHSYRAEVLALAYINISFYRFNLYDNDVSKLADVSRGSWELENQ